MCPSLPTPFKVENISPADLLHGPRLRFRHDRASILLKHVVDGLPADAKPLLRDRFGRDSAIVIGLPFHKKLPAVHQFESPIDSSLMQMMRRTILSKQSF